ncbi:MAG: anhydro-N-acetylmuramic acid kinase [Bacteriovoracia bacterium]
MIRIVGVMTGTSCDGLDLCCVEIDPRATTGRLDWKVLWTHAENYPSALRKRVLAIQDPRSKLALKQMLEIDRDLGEWYGLSIARAVAKNSTRGAPDYVACHGQTVAHFPGPRRMGMTAQFGDPTRIAFHTGLTVISHFRHGDMAAGGQGAPLVPIFHRMLLARAGFSEGAAVHNLGGISNLTYAQPGGALLGFDTGPANLWLDAAAAKATGGKKKFDMDGKLAATGKVDESAIAKLRRGAYLKKPPPKSTGRDDFPFAMFARTTRARGADLVATATAFTARSIADAYRRWILDKGMPLRKIYFCGGGAKNPTLLAMIQAALPEVSIETTASLGTDPQFVEAEAFALLGYLSIAGHPVGGEWTGSEGFAPPGQLTPGRNWSQLISTPSLPKTMA